MALDPILPGGIRPTAPAGDASKSQGTAPTDGSEFKKFLLDNLDKVNEMQQDADQAVTDMQLGKETDINKVMTAVEKADVAFQTLMAVRNKLVESYQDILRMRI